MADLLDRRARIAAANLLMAVDLPYPMPEYARMMTAAAKVCPGIKTADLPSVTSGPGVGRRAALTRARALIDEMLAELPPASTDG